MCNGERQLTAVDASKLKRPQNFAFPSSITYWEIFFRMTINVDKAAMRGCNSCRWSPRTISELLAGRYSGHDACPCYAMCSTVRTPAMPCINVLIKVVQFILNFRILVSQLDLQWTLTFKHSHKACVRSLLYSISSEPKAQYTPPTRRNCRVESRRRCVLGIKCQNIFLYLVVTHVSVISDIL